MFSVAAKEGCGCVDVSVALHSRKFSAVGKYNAPPLEKQTHRDALTVALWGNNMEKSFCSANLSDCVGNVYASCDRPCLLKDQNFDEQRDATKQNATSARRD